MNIAIYRMYYGEDFIERSVMSLINDVDKVFIMYTDRPWGEFEEVTYKGERLKVPCPVDRGAHIAKSLEEKYPGRVYAIYHYHPVPDNQFTVLYNFINQRNLIPGCNFVILMEHDMVWPEGLLKYLMNQYEGRDFGCFATYMVEFWKTKEYIVPVRKRVGAKIFNMMEGMKKFPDTRKDGVPARCMWQFIPYYIYNYGFCMSERNMYWKHLICLEASKYILDSKPVEDWYETKWLTWDFETNNKDLEVSERYRHMIPEIIRFEGADINGMISKAGI